MFKRRFAAFVGRSLLLTVLTSFAFSSPAIAQQDPDPEPNMADNDGNGLIEIYTLGDLNSIRYSLDGTSYRMSEGASPVTTGCPGSVCKGYELMRDLNFDVNRDGRIDVLDGALSWGEGEEAGKGWKPLGDDALRFTAIFDGNQYVIRNLFINRPDEHEIGLFGKGREATIRNLGLVDAKITRSSDVGSLAGNLLNSDVIHSYAIAEVSGGINTGGLVGVTGGVGFGGVIMSTGRIIASYAAGRVSGGGDGGHVGGLIANSNSDIIASYAVAAVSSLGGSSAGGLVSFNRSSVTASYAAGTVSRGDDGVAGSLGGLVATPSFLPDTPSVNESYFDSDLTDTEARSVYGRTTRLLQMLTTYTGIYQTWDDHDLDGDGNPDSPWHFGTSTQYPGLSLPQQGQKADEGCPTFSSALVGVQRVGDRCIHGPGRVSAPSALRLKLRVFLESALP